MGNDPVAPPALLSNYEITIKDEMRKVIRCLEKYDHHTCANKLASNRQGYIQRRAMGEFYYVHPAIPDRAFPSRKIAAITALEAQ